MQPERWQQLDQLFHLALEKERDERELFLAEACAGDEVLRNDIEELIASHEQAEEFIESPASDLAAELLGKGRTGLKVGEQIGPYKIQSVLGIGGMGEVYLATDTRLSRRVALKLLPPKFTLDPERVRRFEQEARAASALNHPNIVTIHEIGHLKSTQFIVTEFVEGQTLRQLMDERPFTLNETLNVAIQVAGALASAHAAGIVHRDIKPENIMLRADGYVKILDFGLAKLTEQAAINSDSETITLMQSNPGLVMGTVQYMSPEQARGRNVDPRADLWSLGVVLYELLAGRVPFQGETLSHVMVSLMDDELLPLTNHAQVPIELGRIVDQALRKDRKDRYQTAQQLAHDLKELKRELQLQGRLKQSVETDRQPERAKNDRLQMAFSPAPASASTADIGLVQPTLSVKYLVREIKRRRLAVALGTAVVIAITLATAYLVHRARRADVVSSGGAIDSVAVLPFRYIRSDPSTVYLNPPDREDPSERICAGIINNLSQLNTLKVTPFNSVISYKHNQEDFYSIGRSLKVRALVKGIIRQQGNHLIIDVEIVDVREGHRFWSTSLTCDKTDLVCSQTNVAQAISKGLKFPQLPRETQNRN